MGKTAVARIPQRGTRATFWSGERRQTVKDPDYRRVWYEEKRLEVESTYVDVPGLLKLSPELTDRFFSLLVSQQLRRVEMPTNTASGAEDRLRQEDGELMTLLGESNYSRFREFQRLLYPTPPGERLADRHRRRAPIHCERIRSRS